MDHVLKERLAPLMMMFIETRVGGRQHSGRSADLD
jgi:hypothetical protein